MFCEIYYLSKQRVWYRGVLPCMGYKGVCCPKGYGFQPSIDFS